MEGWAERERERRKVKKQEKGWRMLLLEKASVKFFRHFLFQENIVLSQKFKIGLP